MKEENKIPKSGIAQKEEEILKFWQDNKIFEKTLTKESPKGKFVFYEGPPTANAKPALHHLEARAFKDVIPRYKTMKGFRVPRKGGWDTHGLPVELQIEKKLGLTSKKDIEKYGVEAFNKQCKESVFEYIGDWEKFTDRIGYWVDKKAAYYTFDSKYIEAVWNVLKTVDDKKLLYKDYKVLPWCPRCGTALSSHELAQGYQDDKDLSVYVKFKVVGEENTYLLAWTTTPWTLPGNVALAINENIQYGEYQNEIGEKIIIANERAESVLGSEWKKTEFNIHIASLLDKEYEPLYPYLKQKFEGKDTESFKKAYKLYLASFVNATDGTGIVHTAVMYGQDDFELGTEVGLPKFHLVNEDGNFIEGCDFLSGRFVKEVDEKGKPTLAVDIIDDLKKRGLFFAQENIKHSYPHCWRCKTPLIYYARDSWYIKMSNLRSELLKENEEINWIPKHIKDGRFGEWLKEVKDWAISRERYWGTPLPIWQNETGKNFVIGSIDELKKYTKKSGNKYFVMRHGEARNNALGIPDREGDPENHLTSKGKEEIKQTLKDIKNKKIDFIATSPFIRTLETTSMVKTELGIKDDFIIVDERICEIKPKEDDLNVRKRMGEFIFDIESKYKDKNILIISHGRPIWAISEITNQQPFDLNKVPQDLKTAEMQELKFIPFPKNENYEIDLHKPYIDEVELVDQEGNKLTRVKEVMDVWFDSGTMPFAQSGLEGQKEMLYPADYISEAIDQTRGWFYTLHAVGVLMGKGRAYKNVICLGHILDAEGKKMSKSVGNIVDPWVMIDKYGVDALRMWMYTVNQPGDSKNFDKKTVDEILKKIFNPLENIVSFYELYKDENTKSHNNSGHILDKWVISSLNKLIKEGSKHLDKFEVFEAGRLVRDFVNDFSTWYVRRSRDRFKSDDLIDKESALSTTVFVLVELAKYMAPFMPFFAESTYLKLKSLDDPESIHLSRFPEAGKIDEEILENMKVLRKTVSLALEKRMIANTKVRQPLASLKVKSEKLKGKEEYLELIKDEVNIKEIIFDESLDGEVELDTTITEELKKEGSVRDLVRAVQDLRKQKNLLSNESIILKIETDLAGQTFLKEFEKEIKKPTNISEFIFEVNNGEELKILNSKLKIKIK